MQETIGRPSLILPLFDNRARTINSVISISRLNQQRARLDGGWGVDKVEEITFFP